MQNARKRRVDEGSAPLAEGRAIPAAQIFAVGGHRHPLIPDSAERNELLVSARGLDRVWAQLARQRDNKEATRNYQETGEADLGPEKHDR